MDILQLLQAGPQLKEAGEKLKELVDTLKSMDAKLGTIIENQEREITLLNDIQRRQTTT